MKKLLVRAAVAVSLVFTAAGAASFTITAANADPVKVSKAASGPLSEAQKLSEAKDFQGALAKVKEAQALPDLTDADTYTINRFLGFISINLHDMDAATTAYEAMVKSPVIPEEDKKETFHNALLLSGNAQHWQQVMDDAKELETLNGMDDKTYAVLAQAYYFTKDMANAKIAAQKSIDAAKAAGTVPEQAALQIVMTAQAGSNDQAGAQATLENLAVTYNSPDSWQQLTSLAMSGGPVKSLDALYVYRVRFAAGAMANADDYTVMAGLANQLKLFEEARKVLEAGIASGKLTAGQANPLLSQVRSRAAEDARILNAASAGAKSGEQLVSLAEDYYGYGRYADAEATAQRALARGGIADPNEGLLILGAAQVGAGKYDDAMQTLAKLPTAGQRGKVVHLWTVYAQALKNQVGKPAAGNSATH